MFYSVLYLHVSLEQIKKDGGWIPWTQQQAQVIFHAKFKDNFKYIEEK